MKYNSWKILEETAWRQEDFACTETTRHLERSFRLAEERIQSSNGEKEYYSRKY
jgi:hypothetical protein